MPTTLPAFTATPSFQEKHTPLAGGKQAMKDHCMFSNGLDREVKNQDGLRSENGKTRARSYGRSPAKGTCHPRAMIG